MLKKDRKLLCELDIDSRRPLSVIARKAGMSQQLAGYKLKSLREKGILAGFYTAVDYSRFGYTCFRAYFSANYISEDSFGNLVSSLMGNPGVIEVNECGGRWDLAVSFLAANASRFNKNLKELMNQNPSLKNYDVVTNAVSHRFPRKFLSEAPPVKGILIGGDREPLKISRRSALALAEILEDARKPLVEISARTGMNPKTVQSAISKLKDIGIVKGFLPVFGLHNIGYVRNRMFVKYHNLSPEREREFVSYCRQARNVTDVHKVLGAWDLEIDIESVPGKELREAIMSIREGFEDIIKESEVVEFFSLHKKSLLTRKALMESTSIEG